MPNAASGGRRPRKLRMLRQDAAPDDLVVVVRATPWETEAVVADLIADATDSGEVYVVGDRREVLYGVSVFALRPERAVEDVLERFSAAPAYLSLTVESLRGLGFEVLPTGANPDHFDVQLAPGHLEAGEADGVGAEVAAAAERLVDAGAPMLPNPAYAGDVPTEEER